MGTEQDRLKQRAAERAVEQVESGMTLGLGSGSTAELAVKRLGELAARGLTITGVPTSKRTAALARSLEIPLRELQEVDHIDLTIDGADEIQPDTLFALKGHGGALLREKLVAVDSERVILMVDDSKIVDQIGSKFAVPVEVVPFGWRLPDRALRALGAETTLRPATDTSKPFVTDNGNYIIDATFGAISDPAALARQIKGIAGVVEHGLFIDIVDEVIVAGEDGVRSLRRDSHP